ncbi:hypothetical protein BH23GEM7_BH23GEM7_14530 [soil metagenome]
MPKPQLRIQSRTALAGCLETPTTATLRSAENLARWLRKPDGHTRLSRDRPETFLLAMLEYVRRSTLYNRLRRLDALEKARDEIEKVHDLGSQATRQRLEDIFYLRRLAWQGR